MQAFSQQQKQIGKVNTSFQNEPDISEKNTVGSLKHSLIDGAGLNYNFGNISVYNQSPLTVQTKLTVNTPGDEYEQEADAVAKKIVKMTDIRPLLNTHSQLPVQRKCAACEKEEEKEKPIQRMTIQRKCAECEKEERLQKKETGPQTLAGEAPASVYETLRSAGQPLDMESRAFFEPRFGRDLSQVRIHADTRAAESAHSVYARAYTVGNHVVFGRDQYAPHSTDGRHLLAHELTHTLQQQGGVSSLQRDPSPPIAATRTP